MWDPDLQMDGQISQSKLTRTRSSLLRPSPTIRSSIHSLSSVTEEDAVRAYHQEHQEYDEEKKIKPPNPGSTPRNIGSTRFTPVLTMVSLTFLSLFPVSFFFFFLLRREEIPTSVNLLLALIFIAITLFFANKNKILINQSFSFIKNLWENSKKFGFTSRTNSKQVQWFIGETVPNKPRKVKQNIREGVEFHSNGDFYEGEFHKGKCNGSGVYNYSLNGRYEGDWVDGRYDGYGIESWTRGSRYRGQYRRGLRHGFGVYRFYTGDSYAGEWFNGQSHGVGVQTCSDGSCYVGKFKCGVKHGLGAYNFRNGDRYAGEYFGDKIHGFGVYHFARGHCYEGSWHEGHNQGYGMYTYRNGDTRCGEWDAGTLRNPLAPSTDAVLRAVQAARKTAGNALNLSGVDDQVNNAVTVANRAATAARVAAVKAVQNQMDGQIL